MARLITSCFGLGRLPIAPGTWGSLPPAVLLAIICPLGVEPVAIAVLMVILAIVGSVACVKFAPAAIAATGRKDPGEVVVDEFAGQSLTFAAVGLFAAAEFSLHQSLVTAVAGFLLFRLFDIFKPWPIRWFEKLPAGWGILLDDLAAGVFAAICLAIALRLWIVA